MNGVLAIAERELRAAFRSPVAYAVVGFHLLAHGIFFAFMLEEFSKRSYVLLTAGNAMQPEHNLMDQVVQPLLAWDMSLFLFLLPALTMRLFSEEWRSGTSELLLTYPLREWEIAVGKLAGAAALFALMLVMGAVYPAAVLIFGRLEPGMLLAGQAGIFLCGLSMLAVGLWWSALTENQVVAFIAAVVTLLAFTFAGTWAGPQTAALGAMLRWLSPLGHAYPFSFGVPSLSDTVYFLSVTAFFTFLTTASLEARRLRARGGA